MKKYLEDLIDVFANNDNSKIDNSIIDEIKEKYIPKKADNESDVFEYQRRKQKELFAEALNFVGECKEIVESIDKFYDEPQIQARECLVNLREICIERNELKTNIFESLVRKFFHDKKWSESSGVIEYYRKHLPLVKEWKDFFFSYTSRNAAETNNDFKKCLSYGEFHIDNRLAEYIVKILIGHNLYGFWDYNDIKLGNDILEIVLKECRKSFCFVQLIEQIVFTVPAKGRKNWCFLEYKEFNNKKYLEQRDVETDNLFFIIQDDRALSIAKVPLLYKAWHSEVSLKKHLELTFYKDHYCQKIRHDIDKIAVRIEEISKEALEKLLN